MYADVLWCAETVENRPGLRRDIALHMLSHVTTSRRRIAHHDRKIRTAEAKRPPVSAAERKQAKRGKAAPPDPAAAAAPHDDDTADGPNPQHRDQGFTRPTVLALLPTRGAALAFVEAAVSLFDGDVENLDRFRAEFSGAPIGGAHDDDAEARRRRKVLAAKGPEWNEWYGDHANDDDDFRLGIKMNDNGTLKLFADFYGSDIILASPLGLKVATAPKNKDGTDGTDTEEEEEKDDDAPPAAPDADFLSSIELCLVLHSQVLLQQNFDHVLSSLALLNRMPSSDRGTDYSRVRRYMLAGDAAARRQLVITSSHVDPALLGCLRRHGRSAAGQLRLRRAAPSDAAALADVVRPGGGLRQVFRRVQCDDAAGSGAALVREFTSAVLPSLRRRTLVHVASYFDYVALRNALRRHAMALEDIGGFVSITEYSKPEEQTRARAQFFHGRKGVLLYTGRAHFFHRLAVRGARHVIFLGMPVLSEFYSDMVNGIDAGGIGDGDDDEDEDLVSPPSVLGLFTKYEALALERIVSSDHCGHMVTSAKSTFLFSA